MAPLKPGQHTEEVREDSPDPQPQPTLSHVGPHMAPSFSGAQLSPAQPSPACQPCPLVPSHALCHGLTRGAFAAEAVDSVLADATVDTGAALALVYVYLAVGAREPWQGRKKEVSPVRLLLSLACYPEPTRCCSHWALAVAPTSPKGRPWQLPPSEHAEAGLMRPYWCAGSAQTLPQVVLHISALSPRCRRIPAHPKVWILGWPCHASRLERTRWPF